MKRLLDVLGRLRQWEYFDYAHRIGMLAGRCWTILHRPFFAEIGAGAVVRRPLLVLGARRIRIGRQVRIDPGATLYTIRRHGGIDYQGRLSIGARTYLNHNVNLTAAASIRIGDDVAFGPNVFVSDFDHDYRPLGKGRLETPLVVKGPVSIGDRCWIGAGAVIASGVELGAECVVGANSVVTRSFPARTVVAGAPARALVRHVGDEVDGRWARVTPSDSALYASSPSSRP